jgi:hypothetical protein
LCGFLDGKPHEAQELQQASQEIRVRPGLLSAVPTGLNWREKFSHTLIRYGFVWHG